MPLSNPIRQWETLVQELAKDKLGRTLLEQWGHQAWHQLEELLSRHPYLQERHTLKKSYRYALWWLVLQRARKHNQLPKTSFAQLGRSTGVNERIIHYWLKDQIVPLLLKVLKIHEEARHKWEDRLPRESLNHRLGPSQVYRAFTSTRDPEQRTLQSVAMAIKNLLYNTPKQSSILFAELRPYHREGPHWLREVASFIVAHHIEIEQILNQQLRLGEAAQSLHLGVVNDTLYLWFRCTHPDIWLNIYANELFYFYNLEDKRRLKEAARCHLGLKGDRVFSLLVAQITNYPENRIPKDHHYIRELDNHYPYTRGEMLHFTLDITGQTLKDIQPQIKSIGIRSQITNPKFPPIEPLRTRLLATMLSDGHISYVDRLLYAEKTRERREIVIALVNQLGEVKHNHIKSSPEGTTIIKFPGVIGRLLKHWGMPQGDRNIQNIGLTSTVTNATSQIKRAYLEELIPEDGTFATDSKHFAWTRGVVLVAGPIAEKYPAFAPKLVEEHIRFITNHGKLVSLNFGSNTTRAVQLRWEKLEALTESPTPEIQRTAKIISTIIIENPSSLMQDEVALCESLGIQIAHNPTVLVKWSSGRISVSWVAHTTSVDDAVRWALLAPPNDKRKRENVRSWLSERRGKGLLDKDTEERILSRA